VIVKKISVTQLTLLEKQDDIKKSDKIKSPWRNLLLQRT
jgi:hypothetical protein